MAEALFRINEQHKPYRGDRSTDVILQQLWDGKSFEAVDRELTVYTLMAESQVEAIIEQEVEV